MKIDRRNLIEDIIIEEDRVTVIITPDLKGKFIKDDFWMEVDNVDLKKFPKDLLLVPFLLNVLPVIWFSGLKFEIESMDANLFDALDDLKQAFKTMYPEVDWNGELFAKEKVKMNYSVNNSNVTLLFSGGLDSVATSYRHLDQYQTLVSIHGSDVELDDSEGWNNVKDGTREHANKINASYYFIESNFHEFLNQDFLSNISPNIPNWWAYIQHGMGLSGLMAVPAFIEQSAVGYIASSHSGEFIDKPWGSSPKIDNKIKWSKLHIKHDSYDLTRQGKVSLITEKVNKENQPIPYLRVCYASRGGKNCGHCEKCCRTMTGLSIAGVTFRDYGFQESDLELIHNVKKGLKSQKFNFDDSTLSFWKDIQSAIKSKDEYMIKGFSPEMIDYIEWVRNYDFNKYKETRPIYIKRKEKIANVIKLIPGLFPVLKYIRDSLHAK